MRTGVSAAEAERRGEQLVANVAPQLAVQGPQAAVAGCGWPVVREVPHRQRATMLADGRGARVRWAGGAELLSTICVTLLRAER